MVNDFLDNTECSFNAMSNVLEGYVALEVSLSSIFSAVSLTKNYTVFPSTALGCSRNLTGSYPL